MDEVPTWCFFFDQVRYREFRLEVDDALSCFGADGQDLSEGYCELAAGVDHELYEFPLERLAERCRYTPMADWHLVCFAQVDDWVVGRPQSDWLVRHPLAEVRDRIVLRMDDGGPLFSGPRDDPAQPYLWHLADGLWCGLLVTGVPGEYVDEPELDVRVPIAAVRAWGAPAHELIALALANVRRAEPPGWRDIAGTVPALLATGPGVAAWAPLLAEQFPQWRQASLLVSVPSQDCLIVGRDGAADAIAELTAARFQATMPGARISNGVYRYLNGAFTVYREPHGYTVHRREPEPPAPPPPEPTLGIEVAGRDEDEVLAGWLAHRAAAFPGWRSTHAQLGALDFSPESLDALEALVRQQVAGTDDFADPAHTELLNAAAWYLGEVVIRVYGGAWRYRRGEPEEGNIFLNRPYVEQQVRPRDTLVPILCLMDAVRGRAALRERAGHYG